MSVSHPLLVSAQDGDGAVPIRFVQAGGVLEGAGGCEAGADEGRFGVGVVRWGVAHRGFVSVRCSPASHPQVGHHRRVTVRVAP